MSNPPKMSHLKNCVKCELHGQNEIYTGGHVRRCPYRQCPCEECQDHDQVLATLSRERRRRKELRQRRNGEELLSQVTVKKMRENMDARWRRIIFRSHSDSGGFMSRDNEGFISDTDDYKDSVRDDGDIHISDELPDPEHSPSTVHPKFSSNLNDGHWNRSPHRKPIITPPRYLSPKVSSPTPRAWSPTSSPSLLSTPSPSSPTVTNSSPVIVNLCSSDSGEDSEGGESIICLQSPVGAEAGTGDQDIGVKEEDHQVQEKFTFEDLLYSTEESDNEHNELNCDTKYLLGLSGEGIKVGRVDTLSEIDTNNNEYAGHQDEDNFRQVESSVPNETPATEEYDTSPLSPAASPSSPTRSPTTELPPATVQLVLKLAKEILKPEVFTDERVNDTNKNLSEDNEKNDDANDNISENERQQSGLELQMKSSRRDVPPSDHYVAYIPLPLNLRDLVLAKWKCVLKQMLEVRDTTVTLGILGPECFIVRGSSGGVEVATRIIEQQLVNLSYNPS